MEKNMNKNRYDEWMLIEDIKSTLVSDDNCRIKVACIESYFNVYEKMLNNACINAKG